MRMNLLLFLMLVGGCVHPSMTGLEPYQWNSRPLLVFGEGPEVVAQGKVLEAGRAALVERDVVVIYVGRNSPAGMPSPTQLRTKLGLEGNFNLVLVGKDGSVKMRRREITSVEEIGTLIDAMPMRQEEMKAGTTGPTPPVAEPEPKKAP